MESAIGKGKIEGFGGSWGSGLGFLVISGIPVPCDNGATVRALESAFGNVIGDAHDVRADGGHIGKEVYFSTDWIGVLEWFCPVEEAPPAMVEAYEAQYKPKRKGKGGRGK